MFSFLGGSSTLLAVRQDPSKERIAPPHPTPVSFPELSPEFLESRNPWTSTASRPDLFQHYSQIRKLSDVSALHLSILNISLRPSSNIESLFSTNEIAREFLPPSDWTDGETSDAVQLHASAGPEPRVLGNGRPYPSRAEFAMRCRELGCSNEDAYAAITRAAPQNGRPAVRLAHFRRFWEALSNVGSYWDTSCDEYLPDHSVDGIKNESVGQSQNIDDNDEPPNGADEPRKRARTNPPPTPRPPKVEKPSPEQERPPGTYRGYRMGNGAGMPDSYRNDAVRAFVEPIAWAFGFILAGHRRPPVLEIKSLLVPVKLSGTVWRPPNQRDKARAGFLQGPVMGISCRPDTNFAGGKSDAVLDTLREVGALLCMAQERARQDQEERKPGEGKWWTTVPRWGGGPGGELGEALQQAKEDDIEAAMQEMMPTEAEIRGRAPPRPSMAKRKAALANAWKTLRVGVGFWDPRTEYCAVGKQKNSEWDEVYLISSLNHHLSIVKLRVHGAYLEYIRTGEVTASVTDHSWSKPIISRSKWYDLFKPNERLELLSTLWGVMGYLARSEQST